MRVFRRRGKYGNRRVKLDGYTFDSVAESRRYTALKLMQMAGAISGLGVHTVYELQAPYRVGKKTVRAITYEADFSYIDHEKHEALVAEDVKGVRTEVFRIKEKLFRYRYPHIELRILEAKR